MTGNPFENPDARRAHLEYLDRLARLDSIDRDLVRLGQTPNLERWLEQITATGGCAHPIYLSGHNTHVDPGTGEILRHYSTRDEPGERLVMRCRNRRASYCPSCSWQYQGDTFQLVRAGLVGGKGVPASVTSHPRVFATLTAPSFGKVHRAGDCHGIRANRCQHGTPGGCGQSHDESDPLVGQALCSHCYDYVGHVLWNAHAGRLWKGFRDTLYGQLGTRSGVGWSAVRKSLRVSVAKVAEYQRRGSIHFHAVIRLDGPTGPEYPPPAWATADLVLDTLMTAAAAVAVSAPVSSAYGDRWLVFGEQIEAHPLSGGDDQSIGDEQVAAYVAKYTSKSVDDSGALDRRIMSHADVQTLRATAHVRALVGTCWRLGSLPELEHLRLRACAHNLGYRGQCLSKTRVYSTTFRALRAERSEYRAGRPATAEIGTAVESNWRYVGRGYTPGEALLAAGIAEDLARSREPAREDAREGEHGR
ncbi:replication initiator [Streptacidiphilus sp. N1-10]|uniref:Replication initiator n=1 Tax=Streptacidiphilus jeojiensis TaxID=3229225 RepID=A0ABV6XPA4_9ACTN